MDRVATVEQFALVMHVDMTAAGSGAAESAVVGSVAAVAGSAAMSGGEIVGEGEGVQRTANVLLQSSCHAGRVPADEMAV